MASNRRKILAVSTNVNQTRSCAKSWPVLAGMVRAGLFIEINKFSDFLGNFNLL